MATTHSDAYAKAGVNTSEGARAVDLIKPLVASTKIPGVIGDIGGFGGMFDISRYISGMKRPILVFGSDGVGTKMELARQAKKWDTVGLDCVAMCVNDITCSGARPITFSDTIVCGKNEPETVREIVNGVAKGCRQANTALIGGEMAEHPGLMRPGEYDLQGFACGIVDADKVLEVSSVRPGDALIGLASNGIHSNGFSLIRKVFDDKYGNAKNWLKLSVPGLPSTRYKRHTFGDWLLRPTRIYVQAIMQLKKKGLVKSVAHITGGGIYENLPRALPNDLSALIDYHSLSILQDYKSNQDVFSFISKEGGLSEDDMFRTFNMGIGMVVTVSSEHTERVLRILRNQGEKAEQIGKVRKRLYAQVIPFNSKSYL